MKKQHRKSSSNWTPKLVKESVLLLLGTIGFLSLFAYAFWANADLIFPR